MLGALICGSRGEENGRAMSCSGPPLKGPVALSTLLARGLSEHPDHFALVSLQANWTWRQLDRDADFLARNLLSLGLQPGDRIASLMPNRCIIAVFYIACIRAGLVIVPLNYRYKAPEIDHALEVSQAVALLAHAEREEDLSLSHIVPRLPLGRISYGADTSRNPRLEAMTAHEGPAISLPAIDPTAPAFIFFTSGSTGSPKGVTQSVETIGWMVASTAAALAFTPGDTFMTASSLSHEGALGFSFAALSAGAGVAIARHFDPDEYLPLLRQAHPTVMWILPAMLVRLIEDQGASREDFASLRFCAAGGDKLPAEVEREFEKKAGFQIHENYGMTENGCVTSNPPTGPNKIGSIGSPAPGYEVQIRDDDGRPLPRNSAGCLWVRSPATMIGYWGRADATSEVLVDGWLDTGDVMSLDDDGYLWFAGRRKQIIVHDGSNISPQDVEGALLEHPAVVAAGVVGIRTLSHGENVRAYVTLHRGAPPPRASDLIAFARERIGYKAPEELIFLDEMPLSPDGKTDRTTLKKMAEANLELVSE